MRQTTLTNSTTSRCLIPSLHRTESKLLTAAAQRLAAPQRMIRRVAAAQCATQPFPAPERVLQLLRAQQCMIQRLAASQRMIERLILLPCVIQRLAAWQWMIFRSCSRIAPLRRRIPARSRPSPFPSYTLPHHCMALLHRIAPRRPAASSRLMTPLRLSVALRCRPLLMVLACCSSHRRALITVATPRMLPAEIAILSVEVKVAMLRVELARRRVQVPELRMQLGMLCTCRALPAARHQPSLLRRLHAGTRRCRCDSCARRHRRRLGRILFQPPPPSQRLRMLLMRSTGLALA